MSKTTDYEAIHAKTVDIVREKAAQNGKSTWEFGYRGQQVAVKGVKQGNGKVRISTSHVKNKGK